MPAQHQQPLPRELPARRLAPVIHFVAEVEEDVEHDLRRVAMQSHGRGATLEQICYHLTARSLALGYSASIAMQEIASRTLPSFPGEEVIAPVLLLDLRALRPGAASRPEPGE